MSAAYECEKTVLGGLLIDNSKFDLALKSLCANDFQCTPHPEIYHTMATLFKKHKFVDPAMLCDVLCKDEEYKQYIYELVNECASTANLGSHMNIIREKSVQRSLSLCLNELSLKIKEQEISLCPFNSPVKTDCKLGNFFIELGHEINATELSVDYLRETLVEINKAVLDTLEVLDEEGQE